MIAPDDPSLARLGETGGPALILYDGDCVICSRWFRFVAERDTARTFLFAAIQSPFGRVLAQQHGIDPDNPHSNAVLMDGHVYLRSDSAIAALSALPSYGAVRALRLIPRPLRDRIYDLIARNRYRWFGKNTSCDLGGARYADRVIG